MEGLRDSIAHLTPAQRAQLEASLRARRSSHVADVTTISPRADQTTWPMSSAQMRIWSLSRLRPDDPVYNMQRAWRLRGALDRAALRASLTEILRRHEALRARFVDSSGTPVQDVLPLEEFTLSVEQVDSAVHDDNGANPIDYVINLARIEAATAFDVAADPLLRARLVQLERDDHVLILTIHHLVCDGWSMDIIERELSVLDADLQHGRKPSLPPLPLQYADFAVWQDTRREGPVGRKDLLFWEEQLVGPVAPLHIPGRSTQLRNSEPVGGSLTFTFDNERTSAIKDFSRLVKATPFMTLLTGFQLALHQATGETDVLLCSPAAGRTHVDTEPLVGYFNNLLVLRGDLSGDPSVGQLLERNRTMVLEAFDHQGTAFQDVAALASVANVPLARGLFVLQESTHHPLRLGGLEVTRLAVDSESADFEFAVFVNEVDDQYCCAVQFHRNLFNPDAVVALMSRFESALANMIEAPASRISDFAVGDGPTPAPARSEPKPTEDVRPRSLLESQLLEIWEDLFKKKPISIHDDFFDLGGHSLLAAELMAGIEHDILGEPVPLATLFHAPTVAELAHVIAEGGWSESWASVVPIQPNGSQPPLFFVHAHGGNVVGYRDLAKRLGKNQPFYGLQAPAMNRSEDEIVVRRLEDIAALYVDEVRTVQREGPYLLGGWCLGGDVAFEMGQQLSAAGEEVAMVLMVDNPRPEYYQSRFTETVSERVWDSVRRRASMEWANFSEVPNAAKSQFVQTRVSRLARWGLLKIETLVSRCAPIPHSRTYRLQRIAAAHEKAYQDYHPRRYSGSVTLTKAARQPFRRRTMDPTLGWKAYVQGEIQVIDAPGHRVGLLSEPRVRVVAEQIRDAISRALEEQTTPESLS